MYLFMINILPHSSLKANVCQSKIKQAVEVHCCKIQNKT